jgi:hypothetical protein
MNLANPAAMAWAALAIPIVVFYILKVRQRRVEVSTTLFWQQIFEEKPPRSLWEHLRHLLSLLVQLAMLGLLVFALAEPFFRWEVLRARRLVLVVDNSASMNATDADSAATRLARAKVEGRRAIDRLRARDEMAIIAAGTEPQVACGLTGHQRTLRAALDGIRPTDGPTRVKEAVELARRLLADSGNRRVILLTDAAFPEAEALIGNTAKSKDQDVEAIVVGKRTGNVAITRFQVRRSLLDPIGYEILAEVANRSDESVSCRLEIDLGEDVVDVVPLTLEPGGTWSKVIEKTSAEGGKLSARIDRADALLADNEAWAILPHRTPRPVTLATAGNLFLEKVLQSIPLVELSVVKEPPTTASATAPSLTVLHRKVPDRLPPGPLLVVDPANGCDFWDLGEPLANPIVTQQEKDSPLMAHVRLDNVTMPEARRLTLKGPVPAQVLAASLTGEPLLCTFDRPEGKVLVLTVDLDKSDLPLQTAFPILVSNALAWFAGSQGELRESLATGGVAEIELPAQSQAQAQGARLLRSPDGRTRPLPVVGNRATIGPLDHCGIWSIIRTGLASKSRAGMGTATAAEAETNEVALACNLANLAESDIRPPAGLEAGATKGGGDFGGHPVWFYLIATAWGLAGLEWYLYQRRWIS